MTAIVIYYILVNLVTFHLYRIDKRRAVQGDYRIPEAVLLTMSFIGGGLGAFCAMREFHHKTLHTVFAVGVPVALAIQTVLLVSVVVYCLIDT